MPSPSRFLALIALICSFGTCLRADEVEVDETAAAAPHVLSNMGTRHAAPEVAPASDEAAKALARMKLPAGLSASLWAAEPMLANPVAFNFDEQGRIFVSETYRYRTSVLDIREYMWMLEDDLACRTIEDRSALILKSFGPAGVKELSIESELVRVLEDRDHDGKADHSAIYATGFNTPLDGIASGVIARRGEVWFTNMPSLWKFTGHDKAETRTELSRGYGVRFNYTGHDMHGLTFGPDGKLYFSFGDRGAHVKTKEGTIVDSQDNGAVFRCNPDGTQLEIFATGLRNPQSLLFTENGDLFTGDNDSDQGDEERLVHLVEGGDSGWRIGYQFAPLGNAGPWNSEKMWHPRHAAQAAFIIPPICNIEDGPSGIAYYPGTGLNEDYSGAIFITHFKGSIARSGIYSYKVKPVGATYSIADAKPFLTNALPTDVKFGPDGRIYYSDWAEGWPKSQRGRIYAIFDPQHVNDPIVKETQALIAADDTKKSSDELVRLLGHPDWRVRLEAQYTLAERGHDGVVALASVAAKTTSSPLARRHAIWGLGQLAEKFRKPSLDPLRALVHDADPEVRAQAIKLLGDHKAVDQFDVFIAALKDENNRVKFFAAQSLGKIGRSGEIAGAIPALLAALRVNNDQDNYLRHALVMGLVGNARTQHQMTDKNGTPVLGIAVGDEPKEITAAIHDDSRAVRLGVLLALRRIASTQRQASAVRIQEFLHDSDPFLVREAALAINDVPIASAMPALAAVIAQPLADEPVMLRVINANFRLGQPDNATALAAYASSAGASASLRAEALAQLALWPKPPARDRIVGVFRPLEKHARDAAIPRDALSAVLAKLLTVGTPEAVQTAALSAAEALDARAAADAFAAVVRDAAQPASTRAEALNALDKFHDAHLTELVKLAGESDAPTLRLAALPIAARLSPDTAAPLLARLVTDGDTDEQKAALKILGTIKQSSADSLLAAQLEKLAARKVAPAVQLELLDAAAKRSDAAVKKLLADRDAALAASGDPLAPFRVALEGGNARRGARIFYQQPVMACARCHNAGEGGGDAGPNLSMVGAKNPREYLLESVVKPNAKIAPGFDTVAVTRKSGDVAVGIVAGETDDTLKLRDMDGKVVEVKKSDIASRAGVPSSMPEIYAAILTKAELRDVVEFLASRKTPGEPDTGAELPRALRHRDE